MICSVPLSRPIKIAKAIELNTKLAVYHNVKTSDAWVNKFKGRHGICQLSIVGENLSVDFRKKFVEKLEEKRYNHGPIFNVMETGLFWKDLPDKTLSSSSVKDIHGFKLPKQN